MYLGLNIKILRKYINQLKVFFYNNDLNLPKNPSIKDFRFIDKLKDYHFHYAYGLKNVKSDFPYTRIENILVCKDIYKNFKNKYQFSFCESCPMDGFISWRLSTMKNINLIAIEKLKKNIEKIYLISKIFGFKIDLFEGSIADYKEKSFDTISMLGCTYMINDPIKVIKYVYSTLVTNKGILYFDMKHPTEEYFNIYKNQKLISTTYNDGLECLVIENTDKKVINKSNKVHLPNLTLFRKDQFIKFLRKNYSNVEILNSRAANGHFFNIYKISKLDN